MPGRKGQFNFVIASLIVERLMPGNERCRLPTFFIVVGKNGIPLIKGGDSLPLSLACLNLRQFEHEIKIKGYSLTRVDRKGQLYNEGSIVFLLP